MDAAVLKVSELTAHLKSLLEGRFPLVWVEGELSNVTVHTSGHCYFTLKDQKAQIRGVMFRSGVRLLRFKPENGTTVLVCGRVSVYEPRGEYQLIVTIMEPFGRGSLQLAFEQTKKKLAAEGLFDPARKKPLPLLPQKIIVITSPTGAAIRDILRVMDQRFANLSIDILPVRVQGAEAPREICAALEAVNTLPGPEVVILTRGGGSMEDLWAFNDEDVARAIARCRVPVVSAVGHEIDFTIADFVADVRAPTPSAAAEMVVEKKAAWEESIRLLHHRLQQGLHHVLRHCQSRFDLARRGLADPRREIEDLQLRNEDFAVRMQTLAVHSLQRNAENQRFLREKLFHRSPLDAVERFRSRLENISRTLRLRVQWKTERCAAGLEKATAQLDAAGPLNILKRGYSITRTWPEKVIVRDAGTLEPKQTLQVKLYQGSFLCRVERTDEAPET